MVLCSSCHERLAIPGVKEVLHDLRGLALPSAAVDALESHLRRPPHRSAPNRTRPTLLVGAMHKTGSELAKKLVAASCARLSLCCYLEPSQFRSAVALRRVLRRGPRTTSHVNHAGHETLDILYSNSFHWLPPEYESVAADAPLIFFYRHPLRIALSSFSYHGRRMEGGHAFGFSACSTGGRPPRHAAAAAAFCRDFYARDYCLDAHGLRSALGTGGLSHADTSAALPYAMPHALYNFTCAALSPWLGRTAQEAWAHGSVAGFAAMAASFWFLTHRVALVHNASLARGALGAQRVLLLDVDDFSSHFERNARRFLRFVGQSIDRPKSETLAILPALRQYDPRRAWGAALTVSTIQPQTWVVSGHVSSHESNSSRRWIEGLMAMPNAREAYAPIFALWPVRPAGGTGSAHS